MIHPSANIWGALPLIGEGTRIGAFCDIGNANIGKNCKIQCHASIPPGIVIGHNVFIGPGVRFANHKHIDERLQDWEPEITSVRDNASIGMGALIAPGLDIGQGAIIGMGAVVTKSVPAGETWVGNPAHKI